MTTVPVSSPAHDLQPATHHRGMGAMPHADGVAFRVWAPHAKAVSVVGEFNDWDRTRDPLAHEDAGYWSVDVPTAAIGHQYRYELTAADGTILSRIDPYAREVTNSVGNGVVHDPVFDWQDADAQVIPPWNEAVIYELHIGTYGRNPDQEGDRPSNFEDVAARFDHLQRLGVNVIQVMPAAEFAGDVSWGYNPAHIFAVESAYGGPTAFKRFVREAHHRGIAVILDVVYNHFGPSDLDLWQFDGWSEHGGGGIYFYNDWRAATPWGETRPDYGRPEVRRFIRDNAMMWLEDFHVDGLRMDMTLYVRAVDAGATQELPDGWSLMQEVNGEIAERFPNALTIAEDLQSNEWITRRAPEGGCGFGAQWDDEFVHPIRAALIATGDQERSMASVAAALTHTYCGDVFRRIVYSESHDEVANGKARVPHEIAPDDSATIFAMKRSTLGAALVFTAPGIPMLFQGQEFLQGGWFQDTVPLDWDQTDEYRGILRLYRDLIGLRRNVTGVTRGLTGQGVQVHRLDDERKLLAFQRWADHGPGDDVMVIVNAANEARSDLRIGFPQAGTWHVRINTAWTGYNPAFSDVGGTHVTATSDECDGLPASGPVAIGAYSVLILSQDPA